MSIKSNLEATFSGNNCEMEIQTSYSDSEVRNRNLSEKGKFYKIELLKQKRKQAYSTLSKQVAKIRKLLKENVGFEVFEIERDKLDDLKNGFNEAQKEFDDIIDEEDKPASYQWFDIRDREFTECRMKLTEHLQTLEKRSFSSGSKKSSTSRSSFVSKTSRVSSACSLRMKAAARSAKLKIELDFLERENEAKKLQLLKEIAIANAEENAINKVVNEENKQSETFAKKEVELKLDPTTEPFLPQCSQPTYHTSEPEVNPNDSAVLKELVALQAKQTELCSLLIQQHKLSHLPVKEPPVFSGDIFEYPAFISAFESIISNNVTTNKDRLYFLDKYTSGKANDVVRGFLAVNSNEAYNEACKLLDQRFGNPIYVAEAYKIRMRNWSQIKDGDSNGIQDFSDFLIRCQEAVKIVGSQAELDSTQILKELSAKLPSYSAMKWCRYAHDYQVKNSQRITFSDFVKFVISEANLANDPIFSPNALRREKRMQAEKDQNSKSRYSKSQVAGSFATNVIKDHESSNYQSTLCPLCDKKHDLDKCTEFKEKNPEERRDFIIKKRLCFGCLKVGHVSASCKAKLSCEDCKKQHPTSLHGVKPKHRKSNTPTHGNNSVEKNSTSSISKASISECANTNTNVCNSTGISNGVTTSMIVPVVLSHRDNPQVEVKIYALLDDGSDSTFIKSSILEDLGINGTEITLKLNTMYGNTEVMVHRVDGFKVQSLDKETAIDLPKVYSRDSIPSRRNQIPSPEVANNWSHLQKIKDKIPPVKDDVEVGILIGCNCPKALKPQEVILGEENDPYAVRSVLGWGIIGPVHPLKNISEEEDKSTCHRILTHEIGSTKLDYKFVIDSQTKEIINPCDVKKMFELDFSEKKQENQAYSQEDIKFLEIMNGSTHLADGHYEMPLPLKEKDVILPNNRVMAFHRLKPLKKRLESDETYRKHYVEFMNKVIQSGYAEKVSTDKASEDDSQVWYIPHHGVYHPQKPNKIRVVFDCSAEYKGESLNKHLLQGPDLTSNLTGVLCRFRKEPVVVMCDIEAMFYQVKVSENCRDLLRFLWWEEGDTSQEPQEYRMTVHLFGATSSPGCSNFALKSTANDNEETLGSAPAEFLRRNFYVDDGLKSVSTVEEALNFVKGLKEMCNRGGFNLHKFTSNNKEVIRQIPVQDRAEDIKNFDFERDSLPIERALGVQWCIESDTFKFTIALKDRPCTRRGILSTVSSIFDPLGFVSPVLLEGKAILQELCRENIGWDDPVPAEIEVRWLKWMSELKELENVDIPRCYKPSDFGKVIKAELHHFSDASFKGYGQCSYLRQVNQDGKVHCSLVIGKARVTPLKQVTIPRLELTAALVSVRVSEQLKRELDVNIANEFFWTDSKVVLGYIANQTRRFHIFVANRIQEIQEKSSVKQWRYVDTKSNPADEASRGLSPKEFSQSKWIKGPEFLWQEEAEWEKSSNKHQENIEISENDPEVKKTVVLATEVSPSWPSLAERLQYFSDWIRAKRAVALCRRYIQKLKSKLNNHQSQIRNLNQDGFVTVQEMSEAEIVILKSVQESLPDISSSNILKKLDTFKDKDGIVRVGGRLKQSSLSDNLKHQVLLPRDNHVTVLVIRHFHEKVHHQGRGITMNEIRSSGYWILRASAAVSSIINKCVKCRKLRGSLQEQQMAELPVDRVEATTPFTYSAVDYFGPFIIKESRKELKRYGVLFTCMASRAVHIEVSDTLETDSFICALRRFIARRGPIRQLRSDQGTNFVGARRELKEALDEFNHNKIRKELQHHDCDWFIFKMNVPSASHMGGVWERQIRSVRNVLSALLQSNSLQLNGESLSTFLCEAEAIVNSRPLTVDSLNDPQSLNPLTPNHLLTMKTKVILPPPGVFQSADKYSRKRWRRVQHLANEFWIRWRKEYLLNLQQRQKWIKPRRNLCVGDIVIIKDDDNLPRNKWQLARVAETYISTDGRVRKVKVAVADNTLDNKGKRINSLKLLDRPVHKLVLLQET